MFTQKQVEDIVDLLSTLDTTSKIYLGCDSVVVSAMTDFMESMLPFVSSIRIVQTDVKFLAICPMSQIMM